MSVTTDATVAKATAWLTSSTTGQGGAALSAALVGYLTHTLTPGMAVVGMVMGLFLVVFPQRTAAAPAVQALTTDVAAIGTAFLSGHTAGKSAGDAALAALKQAPNLLSDAGDLVAALKENTAATVVSATATQAAVVAASTPPAAPVPVTVVEQAPIPVAVVGTPPAPGT